MEMHIGRRGRICYAIKECLERAIEGASKPEITWDPDQPGEYPISFKSVLLQPSDPLSLERDGLLPSVVIQYSDGRRKYKADATTYSTLNEVEEDMGILLRAIFRAEGNTDPDGNDVPITIVAANVHESIDAALGSYGLTYDGKQVPGIKTIKIMSWKVPYDLWTVDYMVIDFPLVVTHVFPRGRGV